ncbi:hypothetical protein [Kutzneria kofuensis]|uniref:hypothetical protein n=1 Tax=Kutzneria kofuensis TaxID=103725 RepID=UPI0033880237
MVGELDLRHEKLAVTGADGQILVVYHAEPDSRSRPGAVPAAGSVEFSRRLNDEGGEVRRLVVLTAAVAVAVRHWSRPR